MHWALMHAVIPQGDMQMTGETGLDRLQPATQLLQTAEQGNAEGGAAQGSDSGDLGSHMLGCLLFPYLLPIIPFIGWWNILKKSIFIEEKNSGIFSIMYF